jgi:hypothetical protein
VERRVPNNLDEVLLLEVDGPDVSPETVDPVALLDLASAFFELVRLNARGREFTLRDLYVIDKCAAVATYPSSVELARELAEHASRQIAGDEPPTHGMVALVSRARNAMKELPRARVQVGGSWARSVSRPPDSLTRRLSELISMRARVERVGGQKRPVRFSSRSEGEFSLAATQQKTMGLGAYLYRDVEVDARIQRGPTGEITGGELLEFYPLAEDDAEQAWREWYQAVGGEKWAAAEDLEQEIRRSRES